MLSMAFLMGGCLRISIPDPFREFSDFWDSFAVICYFNVRPHGMKHIQVSVVQFFHDADKKQKKAKPSAKKWNRNQVENKWNVATGNLLFAGNLISN